MAKRGFGGDFLRVLGKNLRRWRQVKGYTQEDMAEFLRVHRTTYTKYETGTSDPPLETLCRIANLFGCTTDALLGRE